MTTLNLSPEQTETLKEVLTNCLSDLRLEIADTEKLEFREALKEREAVLKQVLDQLG